MDCVVSMAGESGRTVQGIEVLDAARAVAAIAPQNKTRVRSIRSDPPNRHPMVCIDCGVGWHGECPVAALPDKPVRFMHWPFVVFS
jgi:hypothetical protein